MEISSSFLRLLSFLFLLSSLENCYGWHQFLSVQKPPRIDRHHVKRFRETNLENLPTYTVSLRKSRLAVSNRQSTESTCNNHNEDKKCEKTSRRSALKRVLPVLLAAVAVTTLRPAPALATVVQATTTRAAVPTMTCPISAAMEIRLMVRLVVAALIGAVLGRERSLTKHSAGLRTMSLVSMGAAVFTVCSGYGFAHFPRVDASRMAANVATGVGFVGAGVITTNMRNEDKNNPSNTLNTVHGLTTAATIWLSAAVGVACGVGLLGVATTATLSTLFILRLGRKKKKEPSPTTHPTMEHRAYNLLNIKGGDGNSVTSESKHSTESRSSGDSDEGNLLQTDKVHYEPSLHRSGIPTPQVQLVTDKQMTEVKVDQANFMKNVSAIDIDELSSELMEGILRSAWKNEKELVVAIVDRVLNDAEENDRFTRSNANPRKGDPSSADPGYLP